MFCYFFPLFFLVVLFIMVDAAGQVVHYHIMHKSGGTALRDFLVGNGGNPSVSSGCSLRFYEIGPCMSGTRCLDTSRPYIRQIIHAISPYLSVG